jgi:TolA-binding protein
MRADAAKFSADDLRAAEALYQVANKNWRTDEARQSLETMIEKYPDLNRTGCAVLYLGQMSEGADRERYLTRAVEKHGDCFYGDGVQVGAYGRYLLALYHRDNGRADQAAALFNEILEKYPTAVTHRGEPLATIVTAEMAVMPTTRPAK